MPTKPRERSSSGFYHVMQRGVGLFDIFEDNRDRNRYLDVLERAIDDMHAEIYAWCLMSNHTHLLVNTEFENLSLFMQQIGAQYARYFNKRHARPGHLFQDRFSSVPIGGDEQLLATVRYIHRNPIHHDGRTLCGDFPWSSYKEYVQGPAIFTHTEMVLEMLGGAKAFASFHALEDDGKFKHLDIGAPSLTSDDAARALAQRALLAAGVDTELRRLGALERADRDDALGVMLSLGLGLRQVQRLTGVNYNAVRNVAQSISDSQLVGEAQ